MHAFFTSLLNVVCEMSPYLLLGFLIAGILHVFVPKRFYARYLSKDNKFFGRRCWVFRCRSAPAGSSPQR